jgi:3-ketoacyl-CoA synthase
MPDIVPVGITLLLLIMSTVITWFLRRRRDLPVLLLGYSCQLPDSTRRCTLNVCEYLGLRMKVYNEEAQEFMRLIYRKSGIGDETYTPPYFLQPVECMSAKHHSAIQEAEEGLFSTVSALLCKTDVKAEDISLVLVGCSLFAPSPSLSSLLVKRFGFSKSVKAYTLSGMGCSAGTMCIDTAAKLLRRRRGYVTHNFTA